MIVAVDTNCILPGQVGGIENYTLGLIEALQRSDSPATRLVLLTRQENHSLFQPFANAATQVVLVPRQNRTSNWAAANGDGASLREYQAIKQTMLKQLDVQLLHCPGNTINPLNVDLPVVLNLHDLQHRHFPQYFTAEEIANREKWWVASAHRADALIAASDFIRDDLHGQISVPTSKIFVAPDPVQSSFCGQVSESQLTALRQRLKLPPIFFFYPAAAWPHKNHQRLIRAFVAAKIAGAQLLLSGSGQTNSSLPQLVAQLAAHDRVRLLGRIDTADLRGLYHLATALVMPSEHESWSIPIAEAFACGCPVASSNVTSLPQQVGDAGLLFDPHNESAMGNAMRQLAGDAPLRRELSRRGQMRSNANPRAFVQTLQHAYDHAISSYSTRAAA